MATVVPHSLTLRFCSRTALNGRIASHFPRSLISSFNPRLRLSFSMAASTESTPKIVASGDANSEEIDVSKLIQAHQEKAARFSLSPAEEIRTLMDQRVRGMLSTFSRRFEGYPSGSFVDFACDADGTPILAVSSLAEHAKVPEEDRPAVRAAYLSKHPHAFWVDFGDFQFVYIKPKVIRYVSGVATASLASGELSDEEYKAAQVDPVAQFSKPVTSHMNRDHGEDTKNIVRHWTSIPVDSAIMLDLDSLGFNVEAGYQGSSFKLRVPFPRRAENRK
ncbi:hypothetical protein SDJN02_03389 [Cucurbita argyrosperma subsp. argyrosperma]|nr:hypothetical protein SDJN02_03389 [Cucurbita argyrosperma subsp. argyrosperma]